LADICSEVSGTIWKIEFKVGDKVASGDVLIIVESMKMEIPVEAPRTGVVTAIKVQEGDTIAEGQVLISIA
jgi:acetyl-CoA carboxylase biotin carboxyl carrier protein